MNKITQISEKMNAILAKANLEKIGRETGFIQRQRKITPRAFLENSIIFHLENSHGSLADFADEWYTEGIKLSKQALHKKCSSPHTVAFVERVTQALIVETAKAHVSPKILPLIERLKIVDSSGIRLSKGLHEHFPAPRKQGAAVKLQAVLEGLDIRICSLEVRPSNEPDQAYKKYIQYLNPNDLCLADLGYFCVEDFRKIQEKKAHFLARHLKKN